MDVMDSLDLAPIGSRWCDHDATLHGDFQNGGWKGWGGGGTAVADATTKPTRLWSISDLADVGCDVTSRIQNPELHIHVYDMHIWLYTCVFYIEAHLWYTVYPRCIEYSTSINLFKFHVRFIEISFASTNLPHPPLVFWSIRCVLIPLKLMVPRIVPLKLLWVGSCWPIRVPGKNALMHGSTSLMCPTWKALNVTWDFIREKNGAQTEWHVTMCFVGT